MSTSTADGRGFRTLNIVDDYTRGRNQFPSVLLEPIERLTVLPRRSRIRMRRHGRVNRELS